MAYKGIKILEYMAFAHNYNNALYELCVNHLNQNVSDIVDFGSGIGTITKIFKDKGFNIKCVENDEVLYSTLQKIGFDVYKDISFFDDLSIENLISFNVLEHIEDDKEVLLQINKKLKYNAKFFLFLPAYSILYSSFDKNLGHFRRYDKKFLMKLLDKCGYRTEKMFYFDSIGFLFAYIYKIINKKGTFESSYINFYDKYIFPFSKILDKLFKNMFGKNIVAILSKK